MGSNSEPDKQPALDEARLSALRARGPGGIIPPSPYTPRLIQGQTLPELLRKRLCAAMRRLGRHRGYPPHRPTT